jgi:hypothetical protein
VTLASEVRFAVFHNVSLGFGASVAFPVPLKLLDHLFGNLSNPGLEGKKNGMRYGGSRRMCRTSGKRM